MTAGGDPRHAIFAEGFGRAMTEDVEALGENRETFGPLQAKWTLDLPYGELWTREEQLPRKLRSFTVLGILIGLRQPEEIKAHVRMGLANGLTRQEFEEIFYSAVFYGGFPIANTAKHAILEAFAEIEAEGRTIP
ncbi:carboxymuconolactone decarboxylase family protein [Novosphingobium sp. JCM 18896]|uniref:carboxymuconolactone decarboxylase family protein n=1 Tax=Novosphingobium sp. JCM 18896 TaxID=2989731 RepID=UPI0022220E0D|nr:carboxymuconolactone decarboxylase family protein [Novosphingobium sp. JCM 18896]MCW1428673.1 carboxymuconolactone decarboxylase family protein [Novosphingobium sp. JCM 18896]